MEPRWHGTSENEIPQQMLRNLEMDIKEEVSVLLLGGTITATINRNIASDILKNDNKEGKYESVP